MAKKKKRKSSRKGHRKHKGGRKAKACPIKKRVKLGGSTYAAYRKSVRGGKGRGRHTRGFMRKIKKNGSC